MYRSDRERREAVLLTNPVAMEAAYSQFGLFLGLFPTTAIFLQIFRDIGSLQHSPLLAFLFILAIAGTAVAGVLTGGIAARAARSAFRYRATVAVSLLPLIGLVWGLVSGALGGIFIFGIGAFFGAIFGALIGTAAVPVFAIIHNFLRRGDAIEKSRLLPVTIGIALTVSAFILAL